MQYNNAKTTMMKNLKQYYFRLFLVGFSVIFISQSLDARNEMGDSSVCTEFITAGLRGVCSNIEYGIKNDTSKGAQLTRLLISALRVTNDVLAINNHRQDYQSGYLHGLTVFDGIQGLARGFEFLKHTPQNTVIVPHASDAIEKFFLASDEFTQNSTTQANPAGNQSVKPEQLEFVRKYALPALESIAATLVAYTGNGNLENQKLFFTAQALLTFSQICQTYLAQDEGKLKNTLALLTIINAICSIYQLVARASGLNRWIEYRIYCQEQQRIIEEQRRRQEVQQSLQRAQQEEEAAVERNRQAAREEQLRQQRVDQLRRQQEELERQRREREVQRRQQAEQLQREIEELERQRQQREEREAQQRRDEAAERERQRVNAERQRQLREELEAQQRREEAARRAQRPFSFNLSEELERLRRQREDLEQRRKETARKTQQPSDFDEYLKNANDKLRRQQQEREELLERLRRQNQQQQTNRNNFQNNDDWFDDFARNFFQQSANQNAQNNHAGQKSMEEIERETRIESYIAIQDNFPEVRNLLASGRSPQTIDQLLPSTLLGLDQNATRAQINRSYRDLALQYHPDKHVDGHAIMQLLVDARDELTSRL